MIQIVKSVVYYRNKPEPSPIRYDLEGARRASGISTRLMDSFIQKLFTEGEIEIIDHYPTIMSNKLLRDRILRRLNLEHPHNQIVATSGHPFKIKLIK